ncbi:peptidyl-tRNA hydrolase [Linderina pennispora]|uniref:peptidyl-tRNA hydrolase n=1 Tax=Linderina pennispora TaxID=61395 RepID=A0A1Y1WLV1_9FUNG|nr:peptidyl-tRNA hydrolase [Linderina pennispora]ORX74345.1 peptidyl-tRNA hydrolase [Linderina pennispora]
MSDGVMSALTTKLPLWQVEPAFGEDTKLVLIVRTDLGMTKGKVAAQCAHAALGCYKRALKQSPAVLKAWEYTGQAKVTLKVNSEEEMLELQRRAASLGLVAQSICDAGRTQIASGSRTVLGIGPGPISLVDKVSGHLKLY